MEMNGAGAGTGRKAEGSRKVMQTATKTRPEATPDPVAGGVSLAEAPLVDPREWQAERLRLFWERRRFFFRAATLGLTVSTVVVFLIPNSYTSTAQLMPPDAQS